MAAAPGGSISATLRKAVSVYDFSCRCGLVGKALQGVHGPQQFAHTRLAEVRLVDLCDGRRAVGLHQRAVDFHAEVTVVAPQGESVGLIREEPLREHEVGRFSSLAGEHNEDRPVGEVCRDLSGLEGIPASFVAGDGNDLRADPRFGKRAAQAFVGGGAGPHADLLALQGGEARRPALAIENACAGDKGEQAEVDLLAALQGNGGRAAKQVDASLLQGVEAILHRDGRERDVERFEFQALLQCAAHGTAESHAVAGGLPVPDEGKRRRIVAEADLQLAGFADAVQSAGFGGCRCGESGQQSGDAGCRKPRLEALPLCPRGCLGHRLPPWVRLRVCRDLRRAACRSSSGRRPRGTGPRGKGPQARMR